MQKLTVSIFLVPPFRFRRRRRLVFRVRIVKQQPAGLCKLYLLPILFLAPRTMYGICYSCITQVVYFILALVSVCREVHHLVVHFVTITGPPANTLAAL